MILSLSDLVSGFFNGVTKVTEWVTSLVETVTSIIDMFKDAANIFVPSFLNDSLHKPVVKLIGTASNYQGTSAYKVYEVMIPVAAMFLMIYLGMQITDMIMADKLDMEQFAKTLGYAVISLLLMDNAYEFMLKIYEAICDPGSGLVQELFQQSGMGDISNQGIALIGNVVEQLNPFIDKSGNIVLNPVEFLTNSIQSITNILGYIILLPIILIALILIKVTVDWVVTMRAIKIAVYIALSPIAFANIFSGNGMTASKGFTHFKKIISLFLQGPIILISSSIVVSTLFGANGAFKSPLILLFVFWAQIRSTLKNSEETAESYVGL